MKRTFNYLSRLVISALLTALLAVSISACNADNNKETSAAEVNTPMLSIAVIKYEESPEYDSAYRGFVTALTDKGYIEGETIKLKVTCCYGDKDKCKAAAKTYAEENPDLIYTIGKQAAAAAAKATEEIPIIFSCVDDPIKAGLLKSSEKPDKNVTGVSNFTPVYEQLRLIGRIWPNYKNISVVYSETDEKAVLFAALAEEEAKQLGMKASSYPVKDKDQIDGVLKEALEKCDILYVHDDAVTKKCINTIMKSANKKDIRVLSSTETFLENGAFATCVPDYQTYGYSAGEMALVVLKELKPISEIPVLYSDACNVVFSESFDAEAYNASETSEN